MKITRETKQKITKLFKSGKSVDAIMLAVADDFPRITATRVNEVVRKHLFDLADDLWSQAVKIKGICEISGKTYNLEAHHLIRRDNLAYRWDMSNGVCLNNQIHKEAHADEDVFLNSLFYRVGGVREWYDYQKYKGLPNKQVTNDELLQICKALKEFISKGKHNANSNNEAFGQRQRVVPETDTV